MKRKKTTDQIYRESLKKADAATADHSAYLKEGRAYMKKDLAASFTILAELKKISRILKGVK